MRRNIKDICDSLGWDYLGRFGNKYRIIYDGYIFDLDRTTFPPKRLTPSKCLDRTKFATKLMNNKFKNRFSFDKFKYLSNSKKSIVTCNIHGDFEISYNQFMSSRKGGCSFCKSDVTIKMNKDRIICKSDWTSRFNVVHGDVYDYSLICDICSVKEVPIICKIHGVFYQIPYVHERGSGCPSCVKRSGYSRSDYIDACINGSNLYIMEIVGDSEKFIKIGISSDVDRRIKQIQTESGYIVSRYDSFYSNNVGMVYDTETNIHELLYSKKYTPKIKFGGYSECFSIDYESFFSYHKGSLDSEFYLNE